MRCRMLFGNVLRLLSLYILYRKCQDNKNARYYFIAARLKLFLLTLLLLFVAGEYFCAETSCFPHAEYVSLPYSVSRIFFWFLHKRTDQKSHTRTLVTQPHSVRSVRFGNLNSAEKITKEEFREKGKIWEREKERERKGSSRLSSQFRLKIQEVTFCSHDLIIFKLWQPFDNITKFQISKHLYRQM